MTEGGTRMESASDFDKEVFSPAHYTQGGRECIDIIRDELGEEGFMAFCKGTAIKYLHRYKDKGKPKQDLMKAQWYISKMIVELSE